MRNQSNDMLDIGSENQMTKINTDTHLEVMFKILIKNSTLFDAINYRQRSI